MHQGSEKGVLISIITPCLNRKNFIEKAIESVLNQDYKQVEHIIVDGGSTDGTLELLQKYGHLKVISEPDKNLYDALNKGIQIAKGSIIGHLNTDDFYEPYCFSNIMDQFRINIDADSVAGGADVLLDAQTLHTYNTDKHKNLEPYNIAFGMPIINARFFRKSVYEKVGLYDIRYKIAADREFLLRAYLSNIKTVQMDKIIYHYRQHESSLTFNNNQGNTLPNVHPEYMDIIQRYKNKLLSKEVSKACHAWQTWMLGYAAKESLKKGKLKHGLRMIYEGFKNDIFFLPRYGIQLLKGYLTQCHW